MLRHINMCTGKDSKKSEYHKDQAGFHGMMSSFYSMDREDQLIFMAMFDQMVDNAKQEGGNE